MLAWSNQQEIEIEMNWLAFKTLLRKEIMRFSKVWLQTILSPLITTTLYFVVFGVALGSRLKTINGVSYIDYVVPGLIMLSMVNAAFSNSSSSLFQAKIHGTYVDLMVAPIGAAELLLAYTTASLLRASIVGFLIWIVAALFGSMNLSNIFWVAYFSILVNVSFSLLGVISAIFAEKFDHLSIIPNFILTPLTFLGGVFYSIDMLPEPWSTISRFNPLLYMVNGLRYGFLNISNLPIIGSAIAVLLVFLILVSIAFYLLEKGIKLRA